MRRLADGLFRCLPKGQDQINISAGESKEAAATTLFSHSWHKILRRWSKNNVNLDSDAV